MEKHAMIYPSTDQIPSPTSFLEQTRSICPICRHIVDAQLMDRVGQVIMVKSCPEHGLFESLVYGDSKLFTQISSFTKPGKVPLEFSTKLKKGCPYDCGLCPEHHQHLCL